MRSREEIQKSFDEFAPDYTKEDVMLEVLLDIRDLLLRQAKVPVQQPKPPSVKVSSK